MGISNGARTRFNCQHSNKFVHLQFTITTTVNLESGERIRPPTVYCNHLEQINSHFWPNRHGMTSHPKGNNIVFLNMYKQNHRCYGGNPNALKSADLNRSGRIRYQRQETTTNTVSPTSTSYERRSLRTRTTPTLFEIQKVPKACRDGERLTASSTAPGGVLVVRKTTETDHRGGTDSGWRSKTK